LKFLVLFLPSPLFRKAFLSFSTFDGIPEQSSIPPSFLSRESALRATSLGRGRGISSIQEEEELTSECHCSAVRKCWSMALALGYDRECDEPRREDSYPSSWEQNPSFGRMWDLSFKTRVTASLRGVGERRGEEEAEEDSWWWCIL
jgi:hypothetical protein